MGFAALILLDTHAWIWFVSDPSKLSRPARKAIEAAIVGDGFGVSAISVWEVALLVLKNRLDLNIPVREWVRRCQLLPYLRVFPLDGHTLLCAAELKGMHADPADRFIVATAQVRQLSIVTKDTKIRDYAGVTTLW
ncbi:type II toxin-antitoxin system VapC family toxin [bacterium]|nr:type II toxin-antitoxin system VapC family toxin [bacterium]